MSDARRGGGFTLLEVLVAVALLGIVVSVLARSAIAGMSYEGDATRRMRASLIADRVLWGVEAGLEVTPPKPVHEEKSEGDDEYQITLDVQPLELGPTGLDALLPPLESDGSTTAGRARERAAAQVDAAGLTLFQILVKVTWVEGLVERDVTRSTFAYDASALADQLGSEEDQGPDQGQSQGNGSSTEPASEETPGAPEEAP